MNDFLHHLCDPFAYPSSVVKIRGIQTPDAASRVRDTKSESALKSNLANFCPDQTYLLFDKIALMRALFAKLEGI